MKLRLFRTSEWWTLKAVPLLAIAVAGAYRIPGNMDASAAIFNLIVFAIAVFCIASFGYLLNDLGDTKNDARAGRSNAALEIGILPAVFILAVLMAGSITLLSFLPGRKITIALTLVEFALFLLYSIPPLRLKERGFLGLLTDSIYGHVVPSLTAWFSLSNPQEYSRQEFLIVLPLLCLWQFPMGLRHIMEHQCNNIEIDRRAKESNFVTAHGVKYTIQIIATWLVPLEIVGMILFLVILLPVSWLALLGLAAFSTWKVFLFVPVVHPEWGLIAPYDRNTANRFGYIVSSPFFHQWFSALIFFGVAFFGQAEMPIMALLALLGIGCLAPAIISMRANVNQLRDSMQASR